MSDDVSMKTPVTKTIEELTSVVIRFCGDSGDGMQLTGTQFTRSTAIAGNDLATLPDFPAEIRAPAGSLAGVSGYQIQFSSKDIRTPGDRPQVLVAMNPAALKSNLKDLEKRGILIVNKDAFTEGNLKKAGYEKNPLEDGSLSEYRLHSIPISTLNNTALEGLGLSKTDMGRSKNFFALGLVCWMYERPMQVTIDWVNSKFKSSPLVAEGNIRALKAGYHYGETAEVFSVHYRVPPAHLDPGVYRNIMGNEATALGLVVAAHLAGKPLLYAGYPITPASDILHNLSQYKKYGVKTCQMEDEIAAAGAALGVAFTGGIGVTGTSGPGIALKSETISLAVMTELPLVIVNVQRGGPSTGLPTKTEQADLLQAVFGRHGESPIPVVAPCTPGDCFDMIIEAMRIAVEYMTPVLYLSDGYLANGSEPWKVPSLDTLPKIEITHPTKVEGFQPYRRDPTTLARPWVRLGTPGLEHRIGGLEKEDVTGNVCYDPQNHEKMCHLRAEKVARIADSIPDATVFGKSEGALLVVGWGSTYGAITSGVEEAQARGYAVSSVHLRYLNPLPKNLGAILEKFDRVLVPEMNLGQLSLMLRARYLVDAKVLSKMRGQPFTVGEIVSGIEATLNGKEISTWQATSSA